MNRLIDFFARKGVFVDLVTFAVMAFGILASLMIQRETFPNISFDIISVTTPFPGASPAQVERLVTNTLEQDLKEIDGLKKITSTSAEGRSLIILEMEPDQVAISDALDDVKSTIDAIRDLPDDAEEPLVEEINSRETPVIEVSISGDLPEQELREQARDIEEDIESISQVARAVPSGMQDLEIHVEAKPEALRRYSLSLTDLYNAIRGQNLTIPGGTIEPPSSDTGRKEILIRTSGEYESDDLLAEIGDTYVRANDLGGGVQVKDVAKITYELEKSTLINRTDGHPAIRLTVLRKENADVITLVERLTKLLEERKPEYDNRIQIDFVNDFSYYVKRRLSILLNNLGVGLTLVVFFLSLILPFRVALITMLGIPFAFLGAIIIFFQAGVSISLISMFGLIIVVGMLVDDAVVVTDNAFRRMEDGEPPLEAAIKGTQQVWVPVTASVLTTILAFYPLMVMDGIMGKFIAILPLGVVIGLIVSLFECYFILPHHLAAWVKPPKKEDPSQFGRFKRLATATDRFWNNRVVPTYLNLLKKILRLRYLVAAGGFALFVFSIGMVGLKVVDFVLFPKEGIDIFFVRAEAPVGTNIRETERRMKPVEEMLLKLPKSEVKNFVNMIGIHQQDPNDPFTNRGSHLAQVQVFLTPEQTRVRTAQEIIDGLRKDFEGIEGFENLTFARVNPGPPQGRAISIGVRGEEYPVILEAVKSLQEILKVREGVSDVDDSYYQGKEELWVKPDVTELAASNLTVNDLGTVVRGAYEGIVPTSIKKLDESIDIRVMLPDEDRSNEKNVSSMMIRNPFGNLIPVSRVSTIEKRPGLAAYQHEDNKRQVRVYGDVDDKVVTSNVVNSEIKEKLPELLKKHPDVSFNFAGEDEDTQESLQSLGTAALIAVAGIFLVLVFTFNSIIQSLLIMSATLPLGLISVIWAFFTHGEPLSFMALMGTVALAGIIVNNAIVFVSFVNEQRAKGVGRFDSLIAAAKMRIRPIFLTTVTTVCGILPTAYGIGGLDPFVVPCALALGWGVFFGSLLTLFIFPPAAAIVDDIQVVSKKITRKVFRVKSQTQTA